ncbi:epithelial cell-transforming sequence 2 oncogene-like [Saccoglossus kowalevskii]|uniref:Epithelial cell-transforming sequence 2 oncogene-like n=1 Tax=Saccoglossus kowalevskii TaxID=10224 RepID=A0ABM0GIN4_SACKO|nr:PREDICTED: epithelial cell-transforming sequence 2 oncogene-like [Saccoglossus kowalevskii]
MTTKTRTPRSAMDPLASLREPTFPTERTAQSVKKTHDPSSLTSDNFKTHKMKNYMSTWTPILHKPSNDQIFVERRDLVAHWFDLWTDSQRKRFLGYIFQHCKKSQLLFVQEWFANKVPLSKSDFTVVLPKILALYVFSFLDPRSLSRASMVCWHWKFLTEQDELWMPKCVKFGWFLPYSPDKNEYGAWKRHYIACLQTLDVVQPSKGNSFYGTLSDGLGVSGEGKKKKKRTVPTDDRPPWLNNDPKPNDLENSHRAMMSSVNPNDPALPTSAYLYAGRFGINQKGRPSQKLSKSWSGGLTELEYGIETNERRQKHRAVTSGEDIYGKTKGTLSHSIAMEAYRDTGVAMEQPWETPQKRPVSRRLSSCTFPIGFNSDSNKCSDSGNTKEFQIVLDAVLFGVIPIVYEFEGTTLESLLERLESVLAGRHARSIGLFVDGSPGEVKLVQYFKTNLKTLENDEIRKFWETLCCHVLPAGVGGHVDIFLPLAASESGMELLLQLGILTGLQFSSPTAIVGSTYAHLDSEWLFSPDGITPPALYFNADQLKAWINTANLVQEAINVTKRRVKSYFEKEQKDLAAKVTGEIVFDALSLRNIKKTKEITPILTQAIEAMAEEENVKPIDFIANYLKEVSDGGKPKSTLGNTKEDPLYTPRPEKKRTIQTNKKKKPVMMNGIQLGSDNESEDSIEESIEDEIETEDDLVIDADKYEEKPKQKQVEKLDLEEKNTYKEYQTMDKSGFVKLSTAQLADHPDKRTSIVFEILGSEVNYKRSLTIVKDVYVLPLKAALKSNKAIISTPNLQTIFTDIMNVLGLTREIVHDLTDRLEDWGPHQCLADIFVKFSSKLKVYTNFLNNYAVTLSTIDKCKEQHPRFRAFLRRYDRKPDTKMLTLQELFLPPTRRIAEYVSLLLALERYTPIDHADRQDISTAIMKFTELQKYIDGCKLRAERERKLIQLQKIILNCPVLLEANRYLIKHDNVAHLVAQADNIKSEYKMYQHIEDLGLFLFNDALVVTIRTIKHFPYERSVEEKFKFYASIGLIRLKIDDLPDTKYIRHGFALTTPKRNMICSADSYEDKLCFITAVEKAIQTAVESD